MNVIDNTEKKKILLIKSKEEDNEQTLIHINNSLHINRIKSEYECIIVSVDYDESKSIQHIIAIQKEVGFNPDFVFVTTSVNNILESEKILKVKSLNRDLLDIAIEDTKRIYDDLSYRKYSRKSRVEVKKNRNNIFAKNFIKK